MTTQAGLSTTDTTVNPLETDPGQQTVGDLIRGGNGMQQAANNGTPTRMAGWESGTPGLTGMGVMNVPGAGVTAAATMLGGPLGMAAAGLAKLGIRANNMGVLDTDLQSAGLPPASTTQSLLSLGGAGQNYGAGDAGLLRGFVDGVNTQQTDPAISQAQYNSLVSSPNSAESMPGGDYMSGLTYGNAGAGALGAGPTADQGGDNNGGNHDDGMAAGGSVQGVYGQNYFLKRLMRGSALVHSSSMGRADKIKALVPRGAYVMPADAVSAAGQGNTMAGARRISGALRKTPAMKDGGHVTEGVPIDLSGGEYVIHPHHVTGIGGGSNARGAAHLDQVVGSLRQQAAKHALTAPAPR